MEVEQATMTQKTVVGALRKNIALLNQDNTSKEVPVINRVLLFTPTIRKHLDFHSLEAIVKYYVNPSSPLRKDMLDILSQFIEVVSEVDPAKEPSKDIVDYYLSSILIFKLLQINRFDIAYTLIKKITTLFQTVGYMDKQKEYVVLRIYTYLMVIFNNEPSLPDLLPFLLNNYRECCLHNNFIVCSGIYNCILRVYISQKQYMTAAHFLEKTEFPSLVSDKQYIRYCYYKALVSTVLLDYGEAEHSLLTIYKKSGSLTPVFRETVSKLYILVKLLIGENPDFSLVPEGRCLQPYRDLATVVMHGDMTAYRRVVEKKHEQFAYDGLQRIVGRLDNTVIRIALVKMAKSYSRISMQEIAEILQLDNSEEACFTCMRNIRDGIIQGKIEGGYFVTNDNLNSITTSKPTSLFSKNIEACLKLRKEIMKNSI